MSISISHERIYLSWAFLTLMNDTIFHKRIYLTQLFLSPMTVCSYKYFCLSLALLALTLIQWTMRLSFSHECIYVSPMSVSISHKRLHLSWSLYLSHGRLYLSWAYLSFTIVCSYGHYYLSWEILFWEFLSLVSGYICNSTVDFARKIFGA